MVVVAMAVASATASWAILSGNSGALSMDNARSTGSPASIPSSAVESLTGRSAGSGELGASAGTSLPTSWVSPRIVPLDLPGPHPATWGSEGLPPGLPSVLPPPTAPVKPCDAVRPAPGGQASLPSGCVGHDEPSLSLYSDVPGSGGNLSWSATLPEDGSPTQNQSDLYSAVWFGLVVSDPASWLGQCYVEIQLYPDFNWSTPATSSSGVWSGAAVGWQVDPSSGAVDTCFYSPLYIHGVSSNGYFSMTQGDSFHLRLLGWNGSPLGESVWINDSTTGVGSQVTLYNQSGGFPLDPAYSANDVANALLWTTGGELPASFGLEIGRSGNPGGVTNSTFDGCTPGAKSSSPTNPSVPCPSYDPLSWVNDTLTPWTIGVPTFPSGITAETPSQFGVSSTVGGAAAIPSLSNGTCGSRLGSAYCTYPWFSYSCSTPGFTFGATDFATVTNDFGESSQYPSAPATTILGIAAYSLDNFSLPTCGSAGHTVTLSTSGSGGGSVLFLSGDYSSTSTVSGIPTGNYSIRALPLAGAGFAGWAVSGAVAVTSVTSPSTSLSVMGNGGATALFTSSPISTQIGFSSNLPGSVVVVTPGSLFSSSAPTTTVLSGDSISLDPGVYGLQAGPASGGSFVDWSIVSGGAGVVLASVGSSVTWLTVTGAASTSSVEASYVSVAGTADVNATDVGSGTVTLDGVTVPYNPGSGLSSEVIPVSPGTYPVVATPAPGWEFFGWTYGPASVLVDFNATTNVSFSAGVASLNATFAAAVTSVNAPGSGGRVAVNDVGPLPNDTTNWLPRGTYDLDALPMGGETFLHWTVNNSASLWVSSPTASIARLTVNSTGTVTAVFGTAGSVNVTFANNPAAAGEIRFNYQYESGASTLNSTVTNGTYLVRAIPASGWVFRSWTITNPPLSLTAGNLVVKGGGGELTANFARAAYGVSFVSEGSTIFVNASIGGHILASGGTIYLTPGKYPLIALPGSDTTFLKWVTTGAMFVGSPLKGTTNLTVSGAGTLSAIADGFTLTGVTATPPGTDVGVGVSFAAVFHGATPRSYTWSGLPGGCIGANVNPLLCVPTVGGSSSVVVTVAGANGLPVRSGPLAFEVNGPLTVSDFAADRSAIDLGMTTNLYANITGGTGPYTYSYSSLPSGCASSNASVLACTPTATGTSSSEVAVADALGVIVTATVDITVDPALHVESLSASLLNLTATVPFVLTTGSTGGVPSLTYVYAGLPAGCASSNASSFTCTPGAGPGGNFTIVVSVTDQARATGTAQVAVRVNPLPSISSFTASPNDLVVGGNVTFTVGASGGTGGLNYSYAGLPSGCSSTNAATFECRPILVGVFEVTVTVSDTFGKSVSGSAVLTTVAPPTSSSGGSAPFPWWLWAVVAVLILAAIVGLVLWTRRAPPAPPPKLNPPADAPSIPPPAAWDEARGG